MRLLTALLLATSTLHAAELPTPRAEHVVLCVWDGMRPDFITPETTPNLHAFAERGTFFADNHSFYVTTTEVNGTVLATGVFPRRSTIVANREYRPAIHIMSAVGTETARTVRIGDVLTDGHHIDAMTVAELVRAAGGDTAVAGTKSIGLMHDRTHDAAKRNGCVTLFAGKTYPAAALQPITALLGKWPPYPDTTTLDDPKPNTAQNAWTARALTELLWKDKVPRYSVLWLGDPDFSQHLTSPGSPTAKAAICNCDANFGLMLAALERHGVRANTDVIVVSDHGFSTVERVADPVAALKRAGIKARRDFKMTPADGEVLVTNVGGTTALNVIGREPAIVQQCVDVLQASDFAGVILTRNGLPGTFPLADLHLDSPEQADVIYSYRWWEGVNQWGTPGVIVGEGSRPGFGTHGTFAPSDVHNTLVAGGPDFRAAFRDEKPTGNIDVVPTILHLLGLEQPGGSDGRILTEALAGAEPPASTPKKERRVVSHGAWTQYIQTTTYAGKTYFDEGNAGAK